MLLTMINRTTKAQDSSTQVGRTSMQSLAGEVYLCAMRCSATATKSLNVFFLDRNFPDSYLAHTTNSQAGPTVSAFHGSFSARHSHKNTRAGGPAQRIAD